MVRETRPWDAAHYHCTHRQTVAALSSCMDDTTEATGTNTCTLDEAEDGDGDAISQSFDFH